MKLNKFYNYNDILEHVQKDPDPQYRFSPKVRSDWEINVPEIKDEPDFYAWKNNHLSCVILRRIPNGNLNGYVIVHNSHPSYNICSYLGDYFNVHGGVTLSESISNWHGGEVNINLFLSKLSLIINDDSWIFGFDTMHSEDLDPINPRGDYKVYRNFIYVLKEVTELAEQIDKLKDSSSER